MNPIKKKCEECPKQVRDLHYYKGQLLCASCIRKKSKSFPIGSLGHSVEYKNEH